MDRNGAPDLRKSLLPIFPLAIRTHSHWYALAKLPIPDTDDSEADDEAEDTAGPRNSYKRSGETGC
jgi:hypothetical protein